MSWSEDCIISQISRTSVVAANPSANQPVQATEVTQTTTTKFQINGTKLYIPVVTLSINNNIFLENIKQGRGRTICWNKYRSEITTQLRRNNLDYTVDQTFRNINNCLFFHSKMVTMILQEILLISILCH